jgi:hypothetical protein
LDAATGGNEIFVDRHLAADAGAVAVDGGLFSVELGGGVVADGSGSGTHVSLSTVFRDYDTVWLEVQVGAETLAPRTRVLAAAYALNATRASTADQLNGLPHDFYLDTSSTPQTKNGTINFESASGTPVLTAYADPGSPMAMLAQNSTSSCKIGYGDVGIECYAPSVAGFFGDSSVTPIGAYSYLGYGEYGVYAGGSTYGGRFVGTRPSSSGVEGMAPVAGGHFRSTNTGSEAFVGSGNYGIESFGGYGGRFVQTSTTGSATTYLGYVGYGVWASSTSGIHTQDPVDGTWGEIGNSPYKVRGSGTVSFVQNDPDDVDRVITYHAPESSEVNVYTRGSGRLVNGVARLDLDPTFASTANPDVGLTAQLTPRGTPVALAVEEVTTRAIVVRGPAGSNVAFDYWVTGLRIGFEEMPVVAPKEFDSAIPRKASGSELYVADPGLRAFNGLERHKAMARGVGHHVDPEMKASADLVHRIGFGHPVEDPVQAGRPDAGPGRAGDGPVPQQPAAPERPPLPTVAGAPVDATAQPAAAELPRPAEIRHGLSEFFPATTPIEAGDVVVFDPAERGSVRRADRRDDRSVVGVARADAAAGQVEVALGSVVEVRADAGYGAIFAGDLLASSPTPGAAMVTTTVEPGTILGKALEPLASGIGTIRVLVTLR